MPTRTDVLVVGGGATGVAVARDLAMRGVDVTLVERDGLGAGTSGRSHGVLHSGARYADADPTGARECIEENRIVRDIAGDCVADAGGLFVSLAGDDPDYFAAKRDACADVGIDATEVDPAVARERAPGLGEDVERVLQVPDAVIYPSRLVAATAASAREHGARVHTDAPLRDLVVEDGEIVAAEVDRGDGDGVATIDPEYVVNATGAWAGECASLAGVDVSMRPTRGVMVAVEYPDLGPVVNRCRPPADGDIVVPHGRQAILGTTSVAVDDPDEFPTESWEVERTIEECAAMLPDLADRDPVRTYWGVRPLYDPAETTREATAAGAASSNEGEGRGISRGFVLLDHGRDGVDNFASVVGGKLTTHRLMAEETTNHVCAALDVEAPCRTAEERLPGADDPDRLDEFVAEFGGAGPADVDIVEE